MDNLVVITFPDEASGPAALDHVRQVAARGSLAIKDSAVITKDAEGRTKVHNQVSEGTKSGGVLGGALGLVFGLFFLPVFGIVAGAVAGAMIGRNMAGHVDKSFVDDVTSELTPGTSALFVLIGGDPGGLIMAMGPFQGKVFQTTLDPELEEALSAALAGGQ